MTGGYERGLAEVADNRCPHLWPSTWSLALMVGSRRL